MAVHGRVSESLQNLFPCGVFWCAVAISVELGGSTSILCLSVSNCSSQGMGVPCLGTRCLFLLVPLLQGSSCEGDWETPAFQWWMLLVTRSTLVSLTAFWFWHFICFKFQLDLAFSFGRCCAMSSSVNIPSPSPFALWGQLCSCCQEGWFPFSPPLLSIPIPWKGQEHDSSSVHFQDHSYSGHLCPCGAAGAAEGRGHLCQQWHSLSVKITLGVPIVRTS